jgi:hypothetical protein
VRETLSSHVRPTRAPLIVRDKALGLFKVGAIISEFLNLNENVDKEIKEAKKNILFAEFFHISETNQHVISDLKKLLTSAQGNTLFNKILRIIDDNPPDSLPIDHLSSALKHIVNSDFEALFEAHKYALSQIEQISPQALAILADQRNWPNIALGTYRSTGTKITTDWLVEFTEAYTMRKNIFDNAVKHRVKYSVSELTTRKTIEAHLGEKTKHAVE